VTGAPTNRNAETMPAAATESAAPRDTEHSTPPGIPDVLAAMAELRAAVDASTAAAERAANQALALTQEVQEWRRIHALDKAHMLERINRNDSRFEAIARAAAAE
jgi:hypothetical protein